MALAERYGFRRGFIDVPDTEHPDFALILSTMTSEFGRPGERWDFDVVEQVEGFTNVRVGVMTQADRDTIEGFLHIGMLP